MILCSSSSHNDEGKLNIFVFWTAATLLKMSPKALRNINNNLQLLLTFYW